MFLMTDYTDGSTNAGSSFSGTNGFSFPLKVSSIGGLFVFSGQTSGSRSGKGRNASSCPLFRGSYVQTLACDFCNNT